MLRKTLLAAATALVFGLPAIPALAHEDGYYNREFRHFRDHQEHARFHDDVDELHTEAHEQGFYNRREHRAWHRAERRVHEDFHEDHPSTRHDHWSW